VVVELSCSLELTQIATLLHLKILSSIIINVLLLHVSDCVFNPAITYQGQVN